MFVATATMINDLAPEGRTGEAVSLYSLAIWGGLAAGPVLGELILDGDRFDAVWIAAGISALAAGVAAVGSRETRPEQAAPSDETVRRSVIHPAARGPGTVLLLGMIGFAGFATFVPLYARELGLAGAGAVFALNAVIVIAIRLIGRTIPDRFGPRRAGIVSGAFLIAGFATIALLHSTAGLFAGTAIVSCGQALAFPALMLYVVARAPAAERSSAVGSFTACADLGFAIGAIGLGVVADAAGYRGVFVGRPSPRDRSRHTAAARARWFGPSSRARARGVDRSRIGAWMCASSGAAVSASPASSSAAATSAGSARRHTSSTRAPRATTRSRSWTPPSSSGSRVSTRLTPTAAVAARPTSASGSRNADRRSRRLVIATKTFNPMDAGHDSGLSRSRVRRQAESSLRRLGLDRLPLYLTHAWDSDVPIEETLAALDELVRDGKVGAIGCSNVTAEQLAESLEISSIEGLARFGWVQNGFSLLERGRSRDRVPGAPRAWARVHAVQPARRWLADREVPSRRGAACRLTHDAAARGQRGLPTRGGVRRARGARRRGGASVASRWPVWRSRGRSRRPR